MPKKRETQTTRQMVADTLKRLYRLERRKEADDSLDGETTRVDGKPRTPWYGRPAFITAVGGVLISVLTIIITALSQCAGPPPA